MQNSEFRMQDYCDFGLFKVISDSIPLKKGLSTAQDYRIISILGCFQGYVFSDFQS